MLKATSGSELHDEKANPEPQTQTRTKQKTKSWRQTNDKDLLTWAEQAKSPAKPLRQHADIVSLRLGSYRSPT